MHFRRLFAVRFPDRQTDRQTRSSQYTAPLSEAEFNIALHIALHSGSNRVTV